MGRGLEDGKGTRGVGRGLEDGKGTRGWEGD